MPLLDLKAVTKVYRLGPVEVPALGGLDVAIDAGEMVSIMGPSGSGKSTLMNIIGCLDVPTSGSYLMDSEDVGNLSDDRLAEIRNRKIGFVFQSYNLLPRLTAEANVILPLLYGGSRKGAGRKARDALTAVGLADRADHHPSELSGGQQQRVGIARALVKDAPLILADEPTGNLDTTSSVEILSMLQRLNRQNGVTVVIITHEPEISSYTQRVLTLRDGLLVNDERQAARQAHA